MGWIQFTIHN